MIFVIGHNYSRFPALAAKPSCGRDVFWVLTPNLSTNLSSERYDARSLQMNDGVLTD